MSVINSIGDYFRSLGRQSSRKTWFTNNFFPIGGPWNANQLSDQKAMEFYTTSAALFTVVDTVAAGVSSLPFVLATEDSKGNRTTLTEGDVYNSIFKPNPDQVLSELTDLQTRYLLINGDSYNYKNVVAVGFTAETISLPPQNVKIITDKQGSILSSVIGYEFTDNGVIHTLKPEDVMHVRFANPTVQGRASRNGLSPLQAGQNLVNSSINIEVAISWYFENRGVSNIISSVANNQGVTLRTEDKKNIQSAIDGKYGGAHKVNKIAFSEVPIDVNQLSASSSDMEMVSNYNKQVERVAALVQLPSILVQINENNAWNNGIKEAKAQAYTECYIPKGNMYIKGYERTILKDATERTGKKHVMYIDVEKIPALQPTPEERKKMLQEEVKIGVRSRNSYNVSIGEEPYPIAEMDIPTIQNNIIPITQINGNGETGEE